MGKHTPKHGVKKTWLGSISVLIVVFLAGFLLMTNMRVNRTTTISTDAAELVEQRERHISELQEQVNELSAKIDTLNTLTEKQGQTSGEDAGSSTMLPAIEGPGVTVTLNDSSMWKSKVDSSGSTADIDKYVVHQQDVEAVVNALWAGGAESMQIMDQRVLSNSAVICSGNVLMLQGHKYSPPFTISAIGPVEEMMQSLDHSDAINIYKEYVDAFGLGYEVQPTYLHFDKTPAFLQPLQYARIIEQHTKEEQ